MTSWSLDADLYNGYSHILHTFVGPYRWCNGCTSSTRRGNFFRRFFNMFYSLLFFFGYEDYCLLIWFPFFDLPPIPFGFRAYLLNQIIPLSLIFPFLLQIRSIEMVHKRFESFPAAFVKNMASPKTRRYVLLVPTAHCSLV